MKVMKFGGTSVGSVNSILNLKNIVEAAAAQEKVIVVVSALGGITDKLIRTSQLAVEGNATFNDEFQKIVARHHDLIYSIIEDEKRRATLLQEVNIHFIWFWGLGNPGRWFQHGLLFYVAE